MNKALLPQPGSPDHLDAPRSLITAAGQAANQAAAGYLFDDYRQRRAPKTIRTQTAALILWVQYLERVQAADDLITAAAAWAADYFDKKARANLVRYAQSQQTSLPIYIRRSFLSAPARSLARRYLGTGGGLCEVAPE
jgi:hypothetical protein